MSQYGPPALGVSAFERLLAREQRLNQQLSQALTALQQSRRDENLQNGNAQKHHSYSHQDVLLYVAITLLCLLVVLSLTFGAIGLTGKAKKK